MDTQKHPRKMHLLTVVLLFSASILGCGYIEGTVQKSEKSYLWFTGNTENAVVYIDNVEFVRLSPSYYIDESGAKKQKAEPIHYQVDPGKHEIRVEKDGKVRVKRIMMLGNQMIKEIEIP